MEDDASAETASSRMSDMDNQLSEAFDQGEDSNYNVEKEQFLLETTGKQGGSKWGSGQNECYMFSKTSKELTKKVTKEELYNASLEKAEYNSLDDYIAKAAEGHLFSISKLICGHDNQPQKWAKFTDVKPLVYLRLAINTTESIHLR